MLKSPPSIYLCSYRYARDTRTIILCVIPANQDMSTSDAIQLAQQEDPDGKRTVGVITKVSRVDVQSIADTGIE